jgi:DNA (cytosine-5)-methyltransferase 1
MSQLGTMTFGSLFAGIGGMDLGLERAGMECRWQVEIDPFCRKVLAKHWPNVKRYEDVRTVDWREVERVDLIAGGFPCQPVSLAGLRRGESDERWMWPEFARAVRGVGPGVVLIENVPGLLTRGMGEVLGDLAALGFVAEWSTLSACALGATHPRERLFIVAYTESEGLPQSALGGFSPSRFAGPESSGVLAGREASQWATEPAVGRMAPGFPGRVDSIRALGNAVVPQVAEWDRPRDHG